MGFIRNERYVAFELAIFFICVRDFKNLVFWGKYWQITKFESIILLRNSLIFYSAAEMRV